jgi:hypothetical protein
MPIGPAFGFIWLGREYYLYEAKGTAVVEAKPLLNFAVYPDSPQQKSPGFPPGLS